MCVSGGSRTQEGGRGSGGAQAGGGTGVSQSTSRRGASRRAQRGCSPPGELAQLWPHRFEVLRTTALANALAGACGAQPRSRGWAGWEARRRRDLAAPSRFPSRGCGERGAALQRQDVRGWARLCQRGARLGVREHFGTGRVVRPWKGLTAEVVHAPALLRTRSDFWSAPNIGPAAERDGDSLPCEITLLGATLLCVRSSLARSGHSPRLHSTKLVSVGVSSAS